MSSKKAARDYFDLMEQEQKMSEPDKYYLSRRERKNIGTNDGYCKCGRKDEDGSVGCSRWPLCDDDDLY